MTDCMVVAGTRPEIIKVSRLFDPLRKEGVSFSFVFASQHNNYEMSQLFLDELGLSGFADVLHTGNENRPVAKIAEMMLAIEERIISTGPSVVIVQGDTNATLAATLSALKCGVKVAHVEAGLRSHDLRMPEEHNRSIVDHCSSLLYAPTPLAAKNLSHESVWGSVSVTGNTAIDAVEFYSAGAEEALLRLKRSGEIETIPQRYILATFHRAENVDDPAFLRGMLKVFLQSPFPVVLPLHPRSRLRLAEHGLLGEMQGCRNLTILPPVGYFEFLGLMKGSDLILTDSGGVQEEATAPSIRKRTVVARLSTERPEAITAGYASLAGTDPETILREIKRVSTLPPIGAPCPFGDGRASERIARSIADSLHEHRRVISVMEGAS